jgi:DNA modification methylase
MTKDKTLLKSINKNIRKVEKKSKKVDEWLIPRDRTSFYLTHDYHSYFAAFPPEIVSRLLKKYSKKGDVFLDPFMGGGSSVVEGFTNKRKTIGSDISNFSKFLSKSKCTPIKINEKNFELILKKMKQTISKKRAKNYQPFGYKIPYVTNIDNWFTPESKFDLAILLHHIKKIENKNLQDFFLLAFSAIVRKVSNAKNLEQHLCIKKEKKIPDTFETFEKKIRLMKSQMDDYVKNLGDLKQYTAPKLYAQDCRTVTKVVKEKSVDIVITSPPYGTGSRYTDVYRMNFEWLELDKPIRKSSLEHNSDFAVQLKTALEQIYLVLKKGKYCCFVYGDPSTENSLTRQAIKDAEAIGFSYVGLISCPIEKTVMNHHEKYRRYIPKDFILIFKK